MSDQAPLLTGANDQPPPYAAGIAAPAYTPIAVPHPGIVPIHHHGAVGGHPVTAPKYPAGVGQYGSVASGPPGYQSFPIVTQQPSYVHVTSVVVVGGCPACRVGVLEDNVTCLGICCAILFFPLGLICCLLMRQRRCPNCGAIFG